MTKLSKRALKLLVWVTKMGKCSIRAGEFPHEFRRSIPVLVRAKFLDTFQRNGEDRWRLTEAGKEMGMPHLPRFMRW